MSLTTVLLVAAIGACSTETAAPTEIREQQGNPDAAEVTRALAAWNAIALRTTAAAVPASPPRETRALAMASAAAYDAVVSIDGRFTPFAARIPVPANASMRAAAVTAVHRVMRDAYPAAAGALDASYDSTMALVAPGPERDGGVAVGAAAAAAVLARRAADHAADVVAYAPRTGAGMWAPTAPALASALEPGWGRVTPFVIDSGSQFRPAAPPAVGSDPAARDVAEVMELGSATSTTRTAAQTETARFWIATAPQLWNQCVQKLVVARAMAPAEAARAFLLLNLAGADAIIAAWDAKYAMHQWRPITAIRAAGNAEWTPLLTTPPFPDYPAGHTTYGGAAETVLSAVFGETPGELSITSASAGGVTHRYATFHAITDEVGDARVWGGVHWRTSVAAGRELGRRVAALLLQRQPVTN